MDLGVQLSNPSPLLAEVLRADLAGAYDWGDGRPMIAAGGRLIDEAGRRQNSRSLLVASLTPRLVGGAAKPLDLFAEAARSPVRGLDSRDQSSDHVPQRRR